jgi:preprotein translocase subunit SecE
MSTNNETVKKNDTIKAITSYFKGVRAEWGKINWPERQQVILETLFVIAIVASFTIVIYLMDIIFKWILGFIPGN